MEKVSNSKMSENVKLFFTLHFALCFISSFSVPGINSDQKIEIQFSWQQHKVKYVNSVLNVVQKRKREKYFRKEE